MRSLAFAVALLCATSAHALGYTGFGPYPSRWPTTPDGFYWNYGVWPGAYYDDDIDVYVVRRHDYYREHIPYTVGPYRARRWR